MSWSFRCRRSLSARAATLLGPAFRRITGPWRLRRREPDPSVLEQGRSPFRELERLALMAEAGIDLSLAGRQAEVSTARPRMDSVRQASSPSPRGTR